MTQGWWYSSDMCQLWPFPEPTKGSRSSSTLLRPGSGKSVPSYLACYQLIHVQCYLPVLWVIWGTIFQLGSPKGVVY